MARLQEIVLLMLVSRSVVSGTAQGTEFLIAFLSNPVVPQTTDPQVIISNSNKEAAMVLVSSATNPSVIFGNVEVGPVEVRSLEVPFSYRMDEEGINDKAILVQSLSGPISVSAKNSETSSTDRFLVIPVTKLGTEHTMLTYSDDEYQSEFVIVATTNDTLVNITYPDGATSSVVLQRHESYRTRDAAMDLTGTMVVCSDPVAVFAGGIKSGRKGYQGHIAEQLISVQYWGRTFLTSAFSDNNDVLRIVGYNETTAVRIWRNSTAGYDIHLIHPYEFVQVDLGAKGSDLFLVESNDTVLVGQFPQSNSAKQTNSVLGFTLVLPTEQFEQNYPPIKSNEDLFSSGQGGYVRIVVPTGAEFELLRNGDPFDGYFQPEFPGYSTSTQLVNQIPQAYSGVLGFGLTLYFLSSADSSFQLVDIKLDIQDKGCVETTVVLSDAFDNDCDGSVDEEMVDNKDNDGDRVIDEDTYYEAANETRNATTTPNQEHSDTIAPENAAQQDTTDAPNHTQHDTTAAQNPAQHDTTAAQNPAQHDTTAAQNPAQHDATAARNPAQHDTTAAQNPAQHDTTAAQNPAPHDTTAAQTLTQQGTAAANPYSDQHDTTAAQNPAQQDTKATPYSNQHDTSAAQSVAQLDTTSAQKLAQQDKTAIPNTAHQDTVPPATEVLTTTKETSVNGLNRVGTGVQAVTSPESSDDIGILTILAPSFICGVPLLVIVMCCLRSIMAGVCRKKVAPKDKKHYNNVQPVFRN